ncbi:hypothetical protein CLV80_1035 [Yoonia maritima]|uniref:Uncharacterized protein n=1 Tax=Yoonia maritima TaxID=1435347 RepID=A0A2T0W1L0_9RHOB|nr:hypothetical protein [Yoonia maritima]PRY78684.1 hypothetical protein CLV80_1035 [Yoonia maritima]
MSMQIGNGGAMSETKFSEHASHADDSPQIEPPEPLLRQRHKGLALPLDYLGPLREPVEAIAKLTDAPIEIAFQSVLGTVALFTQHICDVETLAGPAPLTDGQRVH